MATLTTMAVILCLYIARLSVDAASTVRPCASADPDLNLEEFAAKHLLDKLSYAEIKKLRDEIEESLVTTITIYD